ncbi:hypothetical protein UFOVP1226_54 [uncultured Caudovirales phage]|uniref:Uncharacterized protein n=1 Tax=uncultured Caudovirales phage TaxID=2100421 RepID=A0A6J5LK99_9CAUD|nr:hypothetical protein UFOVP278_43 [uncultured Caudovirales phage]CAB4191548.1 hypothetical protein UFOVP1226_54 [uncultured Caudovirales phage]
MKSAAVTVTTSPTLLIGADNQNRVCVLHSGTGSVYIGGADVTSSTGIHLANGTTIEITVPINETLYGITSTSTQTMRVLTPDLD